MPSGTVKISEDARSILRELAEQMGEPMQRVLEKAIEQYRRQHLFDEADAAYLALRADPEAWQEELNERRAWEVTLADDIEPEGERPAPEPGTAGA